MKKQTLTEPEQNFLRLRVVEGKSFETISEELGIEKEKLIRWSIDLKQDLQTLKAVEYDKLIERYELSNLKRLDHLGELYTRLKNELDGRDFTGLPTDKLFLILSDVRDKISLHTGMEKGEILNEMIGKKKE